MRKNLKVVLLVVLAGAIGVGAGLLGYRQYLIYRSPKPLARVDRVMLTWSGDPSSSQSITWRTGKPCAKPQVEFVVSTSGTELGEGAQCSAGASQIVTREDDVKVYYHRVDLTGLRPGTLYAYRVGDGVNWSEWNQFRTADASAKPFKFLYMGDAQNDIASMCSRVVRAATLKAPDARFFVHAGDLITTADDDQQWGQWFQTGGWAFRAIPSVPVAGNHEQPAKGHSGLSVYWKPQFAVPDNGPAGLEGTAYYLNYQDVLFVALNGSRNLPEQAAWLDKVLEENKGRTWTIVGIHQPMFSSGKERQSQENQTLLMPVLDKHKVDLVLQGHDHTYARTHKVCAGKVVEAQEDGTVYCTSVMGPKQYSWNPRYEQLMARKGTQTQLFQVISVGEKALRYESWTANDELFDSFELRKNGEARELVETGPGQDTPTNASAMK